MSQHDSTSTPSPGAHPGPYGGPQTGLSGRGARFFDWMRSLGITRTDGWLGGVCAGVAYRIGIDPLIVRGIVVVAAVLGAPLLLIYAVAWALLPDRDGRIHLQRAFEGDFEPPMVAIGVMVLLSLIPWTSGWWFDGPFWHLPGWGEVVGRILWTLLVLGAGVALIVVAVRNSQARGATAADAAPTGSTGAGTARPGASPAAASPAATETTATVPYAERLAGPSASGSASAADQEPSPHDQTTSPDSAAAAVPPGTAAPTLDIAAEPAAPPTPPEGASPRDVADWQERQARWKAEHAQWKRRLDEDMRAVKAQRSAELRSQAAAASAAAAARRSAYRASNPRIGAAIGWLAVGLALVAGALAAIVWPQSPELARYASAAGFAAATFVLGAVVLIAGLARRRSGFLIFLGIVLALLTVGAMLWPGAASGDFTTVGDGLRVVWTW